MERASWLGKRVKEGGRRRRRRKRRSEQAFIPEDGWSTTTYRLDCGLPFHLVTLLCRRILKVVGVEVVQVFTQRVDIHNPVPKPPPYEHINLEGVI